MNRITEREMRKMYDEMLEETKMEWIKNYDGGRVLKEIDPIAYDVGYNDFEDSMANEGVVVEGGEYDE